MKVVTVVLVSVVVALITEEDDDTRRTVSVFLDGVESKVEFLQPATIEVINTTAFNASSKYFLLGKLIPPS